MHTENAMAMVPGIIFGELDGGGMVLDSDSGEYVPVDQVLKDPLRIAGKDILDQDHFGCLRLDPADVRWDQDTEPDDDIDFGVLAQRQNCLDTQKELTTLIAAQEIDMKTTGTGVTCTKGRRRANRGDHKSNRGRFYENSTRGNDVFL
jgi:hypothetical protein